MVNADSARATGQLPDKEGQAAVTTLLSGQIIQSLCHTARIEFSDMKSSPADL